jgi:quinoprotein glucose dehydrogenase
MARFFPLALLTLAGILSTSRTLLAQATGPDYVPDRPYAPKVAPASKEAETALQRIHVPPGLRIDLFAAEPMLANPVCFCVDAQNRFYVAETFRFQSGVTDDRSHMDWLNEDLASRTVADRIALMKRKLGPAAKDWTIEHERVRLLEDTKGTGKADRSTVFADGFHHLEEGVGAGLLAHGGNVWYTCIPNLWLLRDTKGTGKADVRKVLQTGYGVHISFIGHDLHGLRFGPDGKLYFSIGDRGLHVQCGGRTVSCPDSGAVLRCNPDGSELEIVATGLRNPQELAFDKYGNLFTGDNNADHGDKARWVYAVEGGDSGWRIGYQYLMNQPVDLGPWNAEKLWLPHWDGQAAYIVPPIANVADGPSGLTYYPGTGLSQRYNDHFFLCDFRGDMSHSGVRSFAVKPHGASFDFVDQHQFVWSVLATDTDFGMDGCLYILDWVNGWDQPQKGRIYKVYDPEHIKNPVVHEVRKLMAEGMAHRSLAELSRLLRHPDQRVRQEAQFALAERGAESISVLSEVARNDKSKLARLHALWGLGQIGRKNELALAPIVALLGDRDPEVQAQAAKVAGDDHVAAAYDQLVTLLNDSEARVRFFAALGVGKLGRKEAVGPVLAMLRDNADQDVYLRHAGVMALTWLDDRQALESAAHDSSAAVRMAALLAMRRLEMPEIAQFLHDADAKLVVEAARAIFDVPILQALPQLAALHQESGLSDPLWYRILAANFRLGKAGNATAVAGVAARSDVPTPIRVEALQELEQWAKPQGRDRIVGLWRPVVPRPAELAAKAVRPVLGGIFSGPDRVRQEGARLAVKLGIKEVGPVLLAMISETGGPAQERVEALKGLLALHDDHLAQAMKRALVDSDARVRAEGRRVLAELEPNKAPRELANVLEHGTQTEQQGALSVLGTMKCPQADALLSHWLEKLQAGQVPLALQLDLLQAAALRSAPEIKQKLTRYEAGRPHSDLLAANREALAGGDAESGQRIFLHKAEVSCVRCHKLKGEGGEVGPDLTGVGSRQKREYLLESILDPNKDIAKGFETVVLSLTNGQFVTGIVKSEDTREVRLITAEGKLVTVPKSQIEDRQRGKSAMPDDVSKFLSKAELRDLVEFLASQK